MDGAQHLAPDGVLPQLLGAAQAAALQAAMGRAAWRGRVSVAAAQDLFNWDRLNQALAEQRFDRSRLYLSGAGRRALRDPSGRVDAARLTAALRGGATLILNAAQDANPGLQAVCEGLAVEFACFCQANLYACWGAEQGFDVHWDDHDVIVVQAEGRKRWALYGLNRDAPLVQGDPPHHRRPDEPVDAFVLEAGDVLYLPRGLWHAAVGAGEPSLHLTIGLTRRTGVDFLHWLADRLAAEALFRRDLPFERGDDAVADRLREALAVLASQDVRGLVAEYRRRLEATMQAAPRLSFPAIGGPETVPGPEQQVRLAPGAARLEAATGAESAILSWRGDRYTVSATLAGVLRRLTAGEAVLFGDFMGCAAPDDAIAFVREMVGRGVFLLGRRA